MLYHFTITVILSLEKYTSFPKKKKFFFEQRKIFRNFSFVALLCNELFDQDN